MTGRKPVPRYPSLAPCGRNEFSSVSSKHAELPANACALTMFNDHRQHLSSWPADERGCRRIEQRWVFRTASVPLGLALAHGISSDANQGSRPGGSTHVPPGPWKLPPSRRPCHFRGLGEQAKEDRVAVPFSPACFPFDSRLPDVFMLPNLTLSCCRSICPVMIDR